MNELNTIYRDIINQFEFSIIGYKDIDSKLNELFDKLCKSPVLLDKKHIDFISYAFSKLKKIAPFEIETLHNNSFYFNSFNERSFENLLVHDYYAFRHKDFGKDFKTTTSIKTSEIASKLFINPTSYRIITSTESHPVVVFDKHIDVLTFKVPFSDLFIIGKKPIDEEIKYTKSKIFKIYENVQATVFKDVQRKGNKYEIDNTEKNNLLIDRLINKKKIKTLALNIKNKILLLNKTNGYFFFGNIDENSSEKKDTINAFVKLIITHAFLSALFEKWVENIPSVVQVVEQEVNGKSTIQKKCLGNIVLGYSKEIEIDNTERVYFRMISDRISANLASQCVIDINNEIQTQATRAAISQVMARNMSHNIGSHVLSKYKSIDDLKSIIGGNSQFIPPPDLDN